MKFEKAIVNDIEQLTDLRTAYIQEDLGDVDAADRGVIGDAWSDRLYSAGSMQ